MQCLHALQGPGLGFTLVNGHSDYPGHFAGVFLIWCIGRVKLILMGPGQRRFDRVIGVSHVPVHFYRRY